MSDSFSPFRRVQVTRIGRGDGKPVEDLAATEEPLEVRLHGKPFSVIMRTPGADRELAAGFLLSKASFTPTRISAPSSTAATPITQTSTTSSMCT